MDGSRRRARLPACSAHTPRQDSLRRAASGPRDSLPGGRPWATGCQGGRCPGHPCVPRADRAQDRARESRLPLDHVRAIAPGDEPDLRLWQRGAVARMFAETGDRRFRRLLWPERGRGAFRFRRNEGLDGASRRRLLPDLHPDVDTELSDHRACFARSRSARRIGSKDTIKVACMDQRLGPRLQCAGVRGPDTFHDGSG